MVKKKPAALAAGGGARGDPGEGARGPEPACFLVGHIQPSVSRISASLSYPRVDVGRLRRVKPDVPDVRRILTKSRPMEPRTLMELKHRQLPDTNALARHVGKQSASRSAGRIDDDKVVVASVYRHCRLAKKVYLPSVVRSDDARGADPAVAKH